MEPQLPPDLPGSPLSGQYEVQTRVPLVLQPPHTGPVGAHRGSRTALTTLHLRTKVHAEHDRCTQERSESLEEEEEGELPPGLSAQ